MIEDNPFAQDAWEADLAQVIEEHEVDKLSEVDATILAEHLATVQGSLARLIKKHNANLPAPLDVADRAELAQLRKVTKLQETLLAQKEDRLAEERRTVINLEILLKDAYAQRDRALAASAPAETCEGGC